MNSIKRTQGDGTLRPRTIKIPSPIVSLTVAFLGDMMVKQLTLNEELEIEMAKIIRDFIAANRHLFSNKILDAILLLDDEIKKFEELTAKSI